MFLINTFLGITSVACLALALIVLISNPKRLINKYLFILILSCSLWLTSNLLTNLPSSADVSLIFARSTLIGAVLIPYSFVFFVKAFLNEKTTNMMVLKWSVIPVILLLSAPTKLNIESIEGHGLNVRVGTIYTLLTLQLLIYFAYGFFKLYKKYKSLEVTSEQRLQIRYIFLGFIIALIPGLILNAILPLLVSSDILVLLGPNFVIFVAGYMTLAIAKHGLLNVKLIVIRSLAYLLTVGTLVGGYVLAIFGLSSLLPNSAPLTRPQEIIYILLTLIFGFSLLPLKRFFNKVTNRLFYRDAYDAQVLLDKLNKILVGNIDLDIILKQSADIISTTLKAEYVAFLIQETKGTSRRASFSKIVELNTAAILGLTGQKNGKTELIVADEIEDEEDKRKKVLVDNNIAIAAKLAGAAAEVGDQGFLLLGPKQSGNPYNKQDIQILDIIANELVIAIQNALRFEEIETFNITLQQKVNDATRQLRQTNDKLKALDETKDEFISMASHQLRTPLTAVKGYVSMVVEGDAGKLNKQQQELLNQAFSSSQRMVYLIADLLNVSRLKTGKFVIENKVTQLADVVQSEMQQLTEMAKGKQQTLTYTKPDKFPELMLDETKIRQVIMNFADNALHYTPNGGHIQINLEDKGESIEFTVVDDGLGVPVSEQHHLFTKFFRAGNAKKARPDGTGLGLFMAKKVIIAQGGAIIFKSEEGKGSTFGFTFSKAKMIAPKVPKTK